ncbi:MAG: hypothetical protein WDO16_03885 [Bacteroidota bacterium]
MLIAFAVSGTIGLVYGPTVGCRDMHSALIYTGRFLYCPFAAILVIALLTVSFQSIKAAIANPVKSLRTE